MASKVNKSKAIREAKSSGNKAMANGAFAKAARQYTKALELDPGNAVLYSNRSAAHFNLRQFTESLEDAESAILCDSLWWKAYKRKGLSLIHMQRYEEAITALEEGLKIVKKNAEMEKNLEFARACQEQAQNLYVLPEPPMMQRLESVPVFIVTDDVGQPFFITYEDGQQVCTFYFDKVDANSTLDWIKTENPDLGDTARVIHITLNQAFNLAQETQKQYYEETTRAAMEEDRKAAMEEDARKRGVLAADVDGSDEDKEEGTKSDENAEEEPAAKPEPESSIDDAAKAETKPETETEVDATDDGTNADGKDGNNLDDLIDDNAPLSFQFRPQLRQVQVAVELLNKHPNPPVKPILRDPPSVRKAKLEAAAAAAAEVGESEDNKEGDANDSPVAENGKTENTEETKGEDGDNEEKPDSKVTPKTVEQLLAEEENEELTVDNFNGIPIFQAKGLTLMQNNEKLLPLFFSKGDLVEAWKQIMAPDDDEEASECNVEVGTLEDVLRRMSESKTKEFDNVFFVPARESMKAIGAKFPLDELAAAQPPKPLVRKATFAKAKQIAARGGTKEEVRAAIKEDLELAKERQRMAEIIAQIEQARRLGGGLMDGRRRSGRIDRTMRRNAQRQAQKQAARNANRNANQSPPTSAKTPTTTSPAPAPAAATTEGMNEAEVGISEVKKTEDEMPSTANIQVNSASTAIQQEPVEC